MPCSIPPALSEDQLSAAIDGVADVGVMQHLQQCSSCRERLHAAQQLEQAMRHHLHRVDCPPAQQLGDYHMGMLSSNEQAIVLHHLQECVRCQSELHELQSFLATSAPPKRAPRHDQGSGWLTALVGHLMPSPPALGLRGDQHGAFLAQAGGATIAFQVQPATEGRVHLTIQLAADDQDKWTGALVELRQETILIATGLLDDMGGCQIEGLPRVPSELRIVPLHGQMIVLPTFELDTF